MANNPSDSNDATVMNASMGKKRRVYYRRKPRQIKALRELRADLIKAQKQPTMSPEFRAQLFADSLLLARLQQGLSQASLAKKAGLQQSAVARIESGKANPSLSTILKLTEALGVKLVLK